MAAHRATSQEPRTAAAIEVVAVSVGAPSWHGMFGRRVFSSIVRSPVPGRVRFGPGGAAGDRTAAHTEEVYAFFAQHYAHWTTALGLPPDAWPACFWGENLLLRGALDERELQIGTRLQIGTAQFQVTSPRVPCFKLAWRLGRNEDFVATLLRSEKLGCYLRVTHPGEVGAGDCAAVLPAGRDAPTVAAVSRLLFGTVPAEPRELASTLATPGLGRQAAELIRLRIRAQTDAQAAQRGRWPGWRRFRISEVTRESHRVKSFGLVPLDSEPLPGCLAGQFVTLRLPPSAGAPVRTWSLSDYDPAPQRYRISIRRCGAASRWMHDVAACGTELDVLAPTGSFVLDRGGFLRVALISAGIGVAPMIAMLQAHAARGSDAPPLLWMHAARSGREHTFAAEVDALLRRLPAATRVVSYSKPRRSDPSQRYDRTGRLQAEDIRRCVRETYALNPFGRALELAGDNTDFYVCGPPTFEAMVRNTLIGAGVNPAAIRSESFLPPAPAATGCSESPESAEVRVGHSSLHWTRESAKTLLELAEQAEMPVASGCRFGACGACERVLRAGRVHYLRPLPTPLEPNRVRICCAVPACTRLELD